MSYSDNALSGRVADQILEMIMMEKRFTAGDKLPNEIDLSLELGVSRTTLREAVRILVTRGILEIQRGKGTFVTRSHEFDQGLGLGRLSQNVWVNVKDLYEMRLIFEPPAAYYAARRATDRELDAILEYGLRDEQLMTCGEDCTDAETAFHNSIARASHNEFMNRLMPILNRAITKGVILSNEAPITIHDSIQDHRYIMDYLKARNAEGAQAAMRLHILNTIKGFGIELD